MAFGNYSEAFKAIYNLLKALFPASITANGNFKVALEEGSLTIENQRVAAAKIFNITTSDADIHALNADNVYRKAVTILADTENTGIVYLCDSATSDDFYPLIPGSAQTFLGTQLNLIFYKATQAGSILHVAAGGS